MQLPSRTIQIRDSMIKVETDPNLENAETENSLEVVGTRYPTFDLFFCNVFCIWHAIRVACYWSSMPIFAHLPYVHT